MTAAVVTLSVGIEVKMLLVADIGNTNITLGLFDGKILLYTFRLTTKTSRTSDEYGLVISDLINNKGYDTGNITNVIVSCVVPNVLHSFNSGIIKYFGVTPILVGAGIKTGIKMRFPNPKEIGADRIADVVAAYEIYGGPVIVIDYSTVTTFDLVDENGEFLAGITSPGIQASAQAMSNGTAKLPDVEIVKPKTILSKDTTSSIQAGLFYGFLGQTEYIIEQIRNESGLQDIKVVATGGMGNIISEATDRIDYFDPNLTMQGLRIIFEKNNRR